MADILSEGHSVLLPRVLSVRQNLDIPTTVLLCSFCYTLNKFWNCFSIRIPVFRARFVIFLSGL